MKRTISVIVVVLTVAGLVIAAAEEQGARQVGWSDLKVKMTFEDPFEALTGDQLMNLGIYARIQTMKKQKPSSVSETMAEEAREAEATLKKENVDINGLLSKREEIKELRKKRAMAMNESLHGKVIKMPGYALPLEFDGEKVKEFLLVPWVGACIHTPPPPPNQIVYVKLAESIEVKSRFEPVWVTGEVVVGGTSQNLYLVDGKANINIGYTMNGAGAEPYKPASTDNKRPQKNRVH